ncbi:hypothetical protein B0F90DRAFT_1664574 [Multifurca ochricompacta]|uniref:Uncharacterized protein n=1 Tax=Multifurca ochricompacta TaxID=376703 RepID=A0AAD4QQ09_9AGAM|nr:hypothetical protein B0F90DRAFT_1664574 [Multifurca ochricompacta]
MKSAFGRGGPCPCPMSHAVGIKKDSSLSLYSSWLITGKKKKINEALVSGGGGPSGKTYAKRERAMGYTENKTLLLERGRRWWVNTYVLAADGRTDEKEKGNCIPLLNQKKKIQPALPASADSDGESQPVVWRNGVKRSIINESGRKGKVSRKCLIVQPATARLLRFRFPFTKITKTEVITESSGGWRNRGKGTEAATLINEVEEVIREGNAGAVTSIIGESLADDREDPKRGRVEADI